MEEILIEILDINHISYPINIERCKTGHGNYVFELNYENNKKIIRLNNESDLYNEYDSYKYWIEHLKKIEIPVPQIYATGKYKEFNYIILEYIEGKELNDAYNELTEIEKKNIAKEIINIQKKVGQELPKNNKFGSVYKYNDNTGFDTWKSYILDSLNNSKERIKERSLFDYKKVDYLIKIINKYDNYLSNIEPNAFLDDVSNKNLLILNGKISGIIDLDWMGFGDLLYFIGYNKMCLLQMETDTTYVDYMIALLNLDSLQKEIVDFYTLVFCVDFMSEKGQTFQDKKIYVDDNIVKRLNKIYDNLINC